MFDRQILQWSFWIWSWPQISHSNQSQTTPKLIPKIEPNHCFCVFLGHVWYQQVYTWARECKHLVDGDFLQKTLQKLGQKPPNGAKGPKNLSVRAWLYITTSHNTQVLFKQHNLIKADGPYRIIYYYEEYLRTNSHWFIARTLKAVKAKADILTK